MCTPWISTLLLAAAGLPICEVVPGDASDKKSALETAMQVTRGRLARQLGESGAEMLDVPGPVSTHTAFRASSHSTWRDRVYSPDRAFDGDYKTAWVEGVRGDGLGEWIEMAFDTPADATVAGGLLMAGFAKKRSTFTRNNSPSLLHVELACAQPAEPSRCRLEVPDVRGALAFLFPKAQRKRISGRCRFTLRVERVRRGTHFRDTSIAEARVVLTVARDGS